MRYLYGTAAGFAVILSFHFFGGFVLGMEGGKGGFLYTMFMYATTICVFNYIVFKDNTKKNSDSFYNEEVDCENSVNNKAIVDNKHKYSDGKLSSNEHNEVKNLEIAQKEINTSTYDLGLWAKALILAEGDKEKQAYQYLMLRRDQLEKEHRSEYATQEGENNEEWQFFSESTAPPSSERKNPSDTVSSRQANQGEVNSSPLDKKLFLSTHAMDAANFYSVDVETIIKHIEKKSADVYINQYAYGLHTIERRRILKKIEDERDIVSLAYNLTISKYKTTPEKCFAKLQFYHKKKTGIFKIGFHNQQLIDFFSFDCNESVLIKFIDDRIVYGYLYFKHDVNQFKRISYIKTFGNMSLQELNNRLAEKFDDDLSSLFCYAYRRYRSI